MRLVCAWGLAILVACGAIACAPAVAGPCEGSARRAECGQSCGVDVACPGGFHCAGGACTAQCDDFGGCGVGQRCDSSGRCVLAQDGAPPADRVCASVTLGANRATPNVILIIDRSSSMDNRFDGDLSRWQTVSRALFDRTTGVVPPLESRIRFGLAMYDDAINVDGCPELVTVGTRLENGSAISAQLDRHLPAGYTPTGPAIEAVLAQLDQLIDAPDQPTVFVLATDGEPNTCDNRDDIPGGRRASIAALQSAYERGIRTYVVSVGTELEQLHLRGLANAGVGNPVDFASRAPFWVATDTAGLIEALDTIVRSVAGCQLQLEGRIDPNQACLGQVRLGNEVLDCGRDWRAVDGNTLELLGAACERVEHSDEPLSATFPCDVVLL